MSARAKLVLVIVVAVAVLIGIALAVIPKSRPTIRPTASVTATPFAETTQVAQLSRELAEKYQTFARADDPAYFASIQPYLSPDVFTKIKEESSRYAGRLTIYKPIRSSATGVRVDGQRSYATAVVKLSSVNLETGKTFNQTLEIAWKKSGDRWTATNIETTEYGQ